MLEKLEANEFKSYLEDASSIHGAYCEKLVIAEKVEELGEILKKNSSPITVSGGGTGMVGGRVPRKGILLSTERLNFIKNFEEINGTEALVDVGPGVRLSDLQAYLKQLGYIYLPNITETNSFIGGNIATSASGSRTFRYGSTRDYVEKLYFFTADGRYHELNCGDVTLKTQNNDFNGIKFNLPSYSTPWKKYSTGYFVNHPMDLVDLLIGGDGTLVLNAGAKLKVVKAPKSIVAGIMFFPDFDSLWEARCFFKQNLKSNPEKSPCSVEFFDDVCVDFLRRAHPTQVPAKATHALYLEEFSFDGDTDQIIERWFENLSKFDCLMDDSIVALDSKTHESLIKFRHSVPLHIVEHYKSKGLEKIGTGNALPDEHFVEYYNYVCALCKDANITKMAFAHIGDAHLHINLLPMDKAQEQIAWGLFDKIMKRACELKGILSAEHGIGKLKTKFLHYQFTQKELSEMKELKRAFDPGFKLNPGNIFD